MTDPQPIDLGFAHGHSLLSRRARARRPFRVCFVFSKCGDGAGLTDSLGIQLDALRSHLLDAPAQLRQAVEVKRNAFGVPREPYK
mgnify:FL=1